MRGFNRAIIAGNLARDPDVRYTVNKKAYARFTVVVNNRYKDQNGEYQDSADYISVVAWGNTAETCGKYLKKGSPVLIEGRIRTGSYDAKDGSGKRYTTDIWVDSLTMLGSREQGTSGGGYSAPSTPSSMGGGYTPTDEDFGKSIGESGFGGSGGYSPGFANDEGNSSDGGGMADIPF